MIHPKEFRGTHRIHTVMAIMDGHEMWQGQCKCGWHTPWFSFHQTMFRVTVEHLRMMAADEEGQTYQPLVW